MSSTAFVDGSSLTAAAWFNDVDSFVYSRLTSVSGTNTVVGTGPVSMTGYATGQRFTFVQATTNTGAATLNITPSGGAALGAKAIQLYGVALTGGELVANIPCEVFYDGTQFQLLVGGGGPWVAYVPTIAADSGTWGALTVTRANYKLVGKTLFVQYELSCTVGSGSPTEARILLPASKSGVATNFMAAYGSNNGVAEFCVAMQVAAAYLSFQRVSAAAWVGACVFRGSFVLELA